MHCLGKKEEASERLPNHLKAEMRAPLEENPEEIFENSTTSSSRFSLFLHQNCITFFQDIDPITKALDYVADSDIILNHFDVC